MLLFLNHSLSVHAVTRQLSRNPHLTTELKNWQIKPDLHVLWNLRHLSKSGPWPLDWPPLTHTNSLRASAVRRAQQLTPHWSVLCWWVVVTRVFICHTAFIWGVTKPCIHSLLSNIAAVFTFCHGAYIWAPRVFLKTASVCLSAQKCYLLVWQKRGCHWSYCGTPKCQLMS